MRNIKNLTVNELYSELLSAVDLLISKERELVTSLHLLSIAEQKRRAWYILILRQNIFKLETELERRESSINIEGSEAPIGLS